MSLKDLFKGNKKQFLAATSINELTGTIESAEFVAAYEAKKNRFIPFVDFSKEKNFSRFGSAEKYYYDSINSITNTYPYDGSRKEKILWEMSSSYLDLYLLDNGYPRTTGYANFVGAPGTTLNSGSCYPPAGDDEYILIKGGPHKGSGEKIYIDQDTGEARYRKGANIWDTSESRENNLKISGIDGNTVEFWLKKEAWNVDQDYFEFICDVHVTGTSEDDTDYGQLSVAIATTGTYGNSSKQAFLVKVASGSSSIIKYMGSSTVTTGTIADGAWHHYAIRTKNTGSSFVIDLFVDGEHNDQLITGSSTTTINNVSGAIVATLGAQAAPFTVGGIDSGSRGWSKFSGSMDEFRYWKTWRNSEQIQTRWFDQVGGGTNTDTSNTNLGVYFKFNEGITQTASMDSNVLDYSGRVSNGNWTGYSTSSRNTGSAIDESNLTNFSGSEFKDPIIYSQHPLVKSYLSEKRKEGKEYDFRNPSNIYYSMPSWIIEEHDPANLDKDNINNNSLLNLTQIVSSYFDELANQIKVLPQLAQPTYPSGSISGTLKPIPFMDRALESKGFATPAIFSGLDALEMFESRDNNTLYTQNIYDIKNTIYKNIYNNLTYINKSKGTEKSFRNLIRCFGVDDDIYKFNVYSNNIEYIYRDNYRSTSELHKLINFNHSSNDEATVYQYSSSLNPNSTTFISGSGDFDTSKEGAGLSFTAEAAIVFPKRVSQGDFYTLKQNATEYQNNYPSIITSSLFGMHTAIDTDEPETTWATNDYANFIVRAVKASTTPVHLSGAFSTRAKFVLTGTTGGFIPILTSSVFDEVYLNKNWNLMVSVYPKAYPNANEVSGTLSEGYIVEFAGVQNTLDVTNFEFSVTGTMTTAQAQKFLASPKRMFIGAHRTNFTGSVINKTDVKFNNLRVWQNKLSTADLKLHAGNPKNRGLVNSAQNAYLFNTSINKTFVPKAETLLLDWSFNQVTGSDSSGEFLVQDLTSGSASQIPRYGWLSNIKNKQFLGQGRYFKASTTEVVDNMEIITAKPNLPESIGSDDMITVMQNDDKYFTREKRPNFFDLYVEKSPYQNISEEMLKFMATVKDFNDLVGHQVDRYRDEYKDLALLRNLFFEKVENAPDIDKYIEYFKWFDIAVSSMIQKIAPMSSGLDERPLRNIIESHILERSKYRSKFPSYEFKEFNPVGIATGINVYDWKFGHHPLSDEQDDSRHWWQRRADRSNSVITSGDAAVDSNRQSVLDVINNLDNAPEYTLSGSTGAYSGSIAVLRSTARPYRFKATDLKGHRGGINFNKTRKVEFSREFFKKLEGDAEKYALIVDVDKRPTCDDDAVLNDKPKQPFAVEEYSNGKLGEQGASVGHLVAHYNLVSSSVALSNMDSTYLDTAGQNYTMVNLHHDVYGPDHERPMQGPFTDKFVGGNPQRHIFSQISARKTTLDAEDTRPEAWRFDSEANCLMEDAPSFVAPNNGTDMVVDWDLPRTVFYREETAKRPLNIKNIQMSTGAASPDDSIPGRIEQAYAVTNIGNYSKGYEIVMTTGRTINNRFLAEAGGNLLTASSDSFYLSGVLEYTLPRRDLTGSNSFIIVNRFASPGDPATMGEGMLDIISGEYSIYNALPWRNLMVRMPLQQLLSDHCKQFGYFSDEFMVAAYDDAGKTYPGGSGSVSALNYDGTGSFQKVNRNTRPQVEYTDRSDEQFAPFGETGSAYDNWYIQHQIPQTDLQYAWITASIISDYTGSAKFWFEQPDFSNAGYASTDITFISSSDVGVATPVGTGRFPVKAPGASYAGFIPISFVNLNTILYENISSSVNQVGSVDTAYDDDESAAYNQGFVNNLVNAGAVGYLNALLLKRNGPYGGASWKLYRKDNHPIVRAHRNENRLSYLELTKTSKNTLNRTINQINITSAIEPPLSSKFKPLRHKLAVKINQNSDIAQDMIIDHTYMNNKVHFTDHSADKFNLDEKILNVWSLASNQPLQTLEVIDYYLYGGELPSEFNPIQEFKSFEISETIYPREQYTYLKSTRQRDNFENNFWRDSRADRSEEGSSLPFLDPGYNDGQYNTLKASASMWPPDAGRYFLTGSPGIIVDPVGAWPVPASAGLDQSGILQNNCSQFNQFGLRGAGGSTYGGMCFPSYNRRIPSTMPSSTVYEYLSGWTLFEAPASPAEYPSYDTYEQYVEKMKRQGKDCGILPEFRISEHMEYYLNVKGGNFLAQNTASYSITGSNLSSSAQDNFFKTYSTTDFLKTFAIANDDYTSKTDIKNITLSAEAFLKFLPYDGFYPADRTIQLAKEFVESYKGEMNISGSSTITEFFTGSNWESTLRSEQMLWTRPIWNAMFAPGILYNSIKSGIAVDYPMHTSDDARDGTALFTGTPNSRNGYDYLVDIPRIDKVFSFRAPFETLVAPEYYLNGQAFVDNEPHPSASLNLTASLLGAGRENYKLAMHNFLAETISFFKEDGKMATLTSQSDAAVNDNTFMFDEDKAYAMRIVLSNGLIQSKNSLDNIVNSSAELDGPDRPNKYFSASYLVNPASVVMYERTGSDGNTLATAQVPQGERSDYYGSSFGPPCDVGTTDWASTYSSLAEYFYNPNFSSASYEPFTPSYYNGYSHIELRFRPEYTGKHSLLDVLTNLTHSTYRSQLNQRGASAVAAQCAQQLSASLNYTQIAEDKSVLFDALGNPINIGGDALGEGSVWVIQPKWETPVLNFKNAGVTLPEIGSGSVARGMWHQKGTYPTGKEGVWMSIQDYTPAGAIETVSLADAVGFSKKPVKIGTVPQEKKISEAIVAIPFYIDEKDTQRKFEINKDTITLAMDIVDTGGISPTSAEMLKQNPKIKPANEIVDMVRKMKKFVIPPKLDFVTNKTVNPFAMFIFDFEVTLKQEDLTNIWQNLSPNIASSFQKKVASLPISVFKQSEKDGNGNWLGTSMMSQLPENTQWMVFKVKQQAAHNYFAQTADSKDDDRFKFNFDFGSRGSQEKSSPDYSYNWPYDFFSLVELAKIDSTITLKPTDAFKTPKEKNTPVYKSGNIEKFESQFKQIRPDEED